MKELGVGWFFAFAEKNPVPSNPFELPGDDRLRVGGLVCVLGTFIIVEFIGKFYMTCNICQANPDWYDVGGYMSGVRFYI
jgi:hypothetical protein